MIPRIYFKITEVNQHSYHRTVFLAITILRFLFNIRRKMPLKIHKLKNVSSRYPE
jgi:hypothetical protein